ncbi:hypothetical protein GJU40_08830 [Bacillus lacus]|uniref:DUF6843 domain-containing protein n=1 Tax=Metabacillus lacus TaxID=1983721 RepID=A0A7X2IZ12_9BACI|nr:hypothetical protein [Metabacillus lacus]MRX72254.1 hypothetical protein [Metabacillus lacus]
MRKITALILILFLAGCVQDDQTEERSFLIPAGYVGWVTVEYSQQGTQVQQGRNNTYEVSNKGLVRTSQSQIHEGWATNHFYYVDDTGKKTRLQQGKMIHGPSSGQESNHESVEYFFVGTEEQYSKIEYVPK